MKRALTVLMAVFAVTLLSGAVLAQSSQSRTSARTPEAKKTFEGDITAIDVKDHLFTVKKTVAGKSEEMQFHVGGDSRVMINGSRLLMSKLEKGEHVTVTYETTNGKHMAKEVMRRKA